MNHNIINSFSLVGNVSKVNEVKEQTNGTKFKYISVCQNNKYKNKNGELVDQANFFDIKIYEKNLKDFENINVGDYINIFGKVGVYKDENKKSILNLVGTSYRNLEKDKIKYDEIYDYDWLNEGDDREDISYGV